jgi:hypothetical protein
MTQNNHPHRFWPVVQAFPILPWVFRIPAANAVRAMIADTGRTGNVVPIVAEIALRLCRGSLGSSGSQEVAGELGCVFLQSCAIYRIQNPQKNWYNWSTSPSNAQVVFGLAAYRTSRPLARWSPNNALIYGTESLPTPFPYYNLADGFGNPSSHAPIIH